MGEKLVSSVAFKVSLDFNGSGADDLFYSRDLAKDLMDSYLNGCRLRQIEGEITLYKIKIPNYSNYTKQDYFDGVIENVEEILLERLKISFK